MRGTRTDARSPADEMRFIPAYAGNTRLRLLYACDIAVHPRVCGEHWVSQEGRNGFVGSSPRMRGTHEDAQNYRQQPRFIPAYAGNTSVYAGGLAGSAVHPRVCGEHNVLMTPMDKHCGSSPRMRGTLPSLRRRAFPRRFIPAYAGNTPHRTAHPQCLSVHPRVCGEHSSCKRLLQKNFHDVKEPTDFPYRVGN